MRSRLVDRERGVLLRPFDAHLLSMVSLNDVVDVIAISLAALLRHAR
jgi:hypothetical protein